FVLVSLFFFFFFFQAEDGIRDLTVTGVQTCALPILLRRRRFLRRHPPARRPRLFHPCHRRDSPEGPGRSRRPPGGRPFVSKGPPGVLRKAPSQLGAFFAHVFGDSGQVATQKCR